MPSVASMRSRPDDRARTFRVTRLLVGCAVILAGWIVVLGATLGSAETVRHWSVTWVGLDVLEVAGLVATAALVHRRSPLVASVGAATAALFAVDAWFDVATAAAGWPSLLAILLALVFEIPLATLCAWLSWYAAVRPRASATAEALAVTAAVTAPDTTAGHVLHGT